MIQKLPPWVRIGMMVVVFVALVGAVVIPAGRAQAAGDATGNILKNGDFESGKASWAPLKARFLTGVPAQSGAAAAQVANTTATAGQLFQSSLALQPQTEYTLTFWARSTDGHDLTVNLTRGGTTVNYGLSSTFDVGTEWQQFTATFTTKNVNSSSRDGRLRFQLPAGKGASVSIDAVSLVKKAGPPPVFTEMLVYDWNKPITQPMSGFGLYNPLSNFPQFNNGDWTNGNFQNGTLYIRAHVKSMPAAAGPAGQPSMKLGYCFWQKDPDYGEECISPNQPVPGVPGTDVAWTQAVNAMAEIGDPIDWSRPRWMAGFVVRNNRGPVTSKAGFNWSGEDPKKWYPMDIHFTVVLVAPGKEFSGWQNYGWTTPAP